MLQIITLIQAKYLATSKEQTAVGLLRKDAITDKLGSAELDVSQAHAKPTFALTINMHTGLSFYTFDIQPNGLSAGLREDASSHARHVY